MTAPLDFRRGERGFGLHDPRREVPIVTFAGLAWAAVLVALAIAVLLILIRLTHHPVRAPLLRPTLGPASWIPTPRYPERDLAALEVGEVRP